MLPEYSGLPIQGSWETPCGRRVPSDSTERRGVGAASSSVRSSRSADWKSAVKVAGLRTSDKARGMGCGKVWVGVPALAGGWGRAPDAGICRKPGWTGCQLTRGPFTRSTTSIRACPRRSARMPRASTMAGSIWWIIQLRKLNMARARPGLCPVVALMR